jgi:hypothetical protein
MWPKRSTKNILPDDLLSVQRSSMEAFGRPTDALEFGRPCWVARWLHRTIDLHVDKPLNDGYIDSNGRLSCLHVPPSAHHRKWVRHAL